MVLLLSKEEIIELEKRGRIQFFAFWDTIENVVQFYSKNPGRYTAFIEKKENLNHAFSTPVKVYKFLRY